MDRGLLLTQISKTAGKYCRFRWVALSILLLTLQSCLISGSRTGSEESYISNSPNSVSVGYGRALHDNPIILSGNYSLSPSINLGTLLRSSGDFITTNQFLEGSCAYGPSLVGNCFKVKENSSTSLLSSVEGKWAFEASTSEFLQVHTFWHMKLLAEKFQNVVENAYNLSFSLGHISAIPNNIFATKANWVPNKILTVYSGCDDDEAEDNSYFSPSLFNVCFGWDSVYNQVKFAQDPTVIYHEVGHSFTDILFNSRNVANGLTERSDLGAFYYDEAGSINEGISDYYSYAMNQRTHFAEWALGRFIGQSRPMSEDDYLHMAGISSSPDSRLSYPKYLNYDPNEPAVPYEDIHYAGQIASHYFVALTEDLKSTCSMSHAQATNAVLGLIAETLSELGDLTATGTDSGNERVNLNDDHASDWIKTVNPVTFRSFFQKFAKYLYVIYHQKSQCNGAPYEIDKIEQLLDQYGLLMFDTYNEDGNNANTGHDGTHTPVSVSNRLYTTLVNKDLIKLDPTSEAPTAYVFDNRSDMIKAVSNMVASGQITGNLSTNIPGDLRWNNSNGKISPGEIVGVALNLYNDSNSTMAGVQVLGNDWDHVKEGKPCNTFEDEFPLDTEGAADVDTGTVVGNCNYITRSNGDDGDEIAPICLVQLNEDDATKWVTQDKLFTATAGLETTDCLDPSDTKSCFIRAIKGADSAFFSKIDPKSTWGQTLASSGGSPVFSYSNLIFFEVSSYVSPGTVFDCRFRVRFSNCEGCFSDSTNGKDDFLDYEYSGGKPFKIINFKFTVVN